MRLSLAISPCPNDTFMFDGIVNRRVDLRGLEFDVRFADIEQLNSCVVAGEADVCKVSYAVLPLVCSDYLLLDSGSALGFGNGPLLVSSLPANSSASRPPERQADKKHQPLLASGFSQKTVAIPGVHTTANLLLNRLFPQFTKKVPMLFSDIAAAVARGDVDAGVLIHEGRFTYAEHGLELVADLGAEWEASTGGLPLPLGAIVASKKLPLEIIATVEAVLRDSIEYAFAHPDVSRGFVKAHARELDDRVIDNHIALFVNRRSLSLDDEAKRAIELLTGELV